MPNAKNALQNCGLSLSVLDLHTIKKLLENEAGNVCCPCCQMPFDKGKKRKLIDACGHEKCYTCVFTNEQCPLCQQQEHSLDTENDLLSSDQQRLIDYDTGIGSSSTLRSPISSPCPLNRSRIMRTNGKLSLQTSHELIPSSDVTNKTQHSHLQSNTNNRITSSNIQGCATPPQNRRSFFNPKLIRNSFGQRRINNNNNSMLSGFTSLTESSQSDLIVKKRTKTDCQRNDAVKTNRLSLGGTSAYAGHLSSLVFGKIKSLWSAHTSTINVGLNQLAGRNEESGNIKTTSLNGKSSQDEQLQVRLGFFLDNNNSRRTMRNPLQSCSSLASANTSPVSTLTGSSEADISRVIHHESTSYNRVSDSIGSLVSMSISEQSNNGSSSPISRRHSVTTAQPGHIEDLSLFKQRKNVIRRSARSGQVKGPIDPKIRFAQYRPQQLTLKPLFFEVPQQEPDPLFIGRHWLLRELSNALSNTESPGVLLNGNPGTGKTALLLQLVEYSCFGRRKDIPSLDTDGIYCQVNVVHDRIRSLASHVVAYHFCQADNNSYCLVPDFIHSMAAQLCQAPQLNAYREHLLNEPHLQNILCVKECIADPIRAFKMAILEPLTTLRRVGKISGKNCIILIDALCEAEYHRPDHGDTIATFLNKMIEFFPSWLKVIATVRTQMLEFVKGLSYTKMTLDNWSTNESLQKDMIDYITFRLNHSSSIQNNVHAGKDNHTGQYKFAQHLLTLTQGSFLFAKLVLDLIERGHLVIKSASYKVLPVSLAQIFLLNFNLRFPTTTAYDKVTNILGVCLAALYPLTLIEIFYSVNALQTGEEISWEEFLQRFKLLSGFLIKRIDNTYMFFHPSFREWLIRREESESLKFICDLRTGHAAIAFRLTRSQVQLTPDQALELGHHILKAHLYRNAPQNQSPRDMQSYWIASTTGCVSSALCTLRNVYSPNIKVSRLLLLAGASADYVTEFLGNAPVLCIAAQEGIVPMVSLLLEFAADVEKTNSQGCTALILASSKGHCDVVRKLVAAGSPLGQIDTSQRCALVHAAREGKINVVKYLIACDWIQRPGSNDVDLREAAQQAMIIAAAQGNIEIVEDLLDMGEVNVNEADSLTGETALTIASASGFTETVSTLISRGASVDIRNRKEMSSLLLAVKEGHWGVAERLLQNHADLEQTEPTGKTSLMIAAEEGHVGIIELLLNRGASMTKVDFEGLTALSWACLRGRLQASKCLIERNADKHHADNTGRTPLDLAAYQGSSGLVHMLIEYGAKIEHVDINGMRPLDRAIACRNVQVVQVFLKRGAKLGPATWAMAAGKPEILLLLLNKLLEDGNILYRKGRIQEAAHRYQYALKKIPLKEHLDHNNTFVQLKFNFLLNYSRCRRKMNETLEAVELSNEAIELKPDNYDGYFARAKAHFELRNFVQASKDTQSALERSKSTSIQIKNILLRLRDDIETQQLLFSTQQSQDIMTDL